MKRCRCLLAVASIVAAGAAAAQNYPTKPVRFIVTYPPGGSSEVMARVIGQQLGEYWSQQVIVELQQVGIGLLPLGATEQGGEDGSHFRFPSAVAAVLPLERGGI